MFLHKSHTWEKSGSWDIGQNALGQSDCSIFKSTISLEQNDEKAWFFACRYRFMENRSWVENIGVGMVKNVCGYSVLKTLKLAVCQGKINEINWFWCVDANSWKLKVTLTVFGWWLSEMGMAAFKILEL